MKKKKHIKKLVTIHQPETFPYPGFFNKMMLSDEFIILDNVQFKKNNYQNRNRIIHEGNPKWITFPVDMTHRLESTIMDTKFADTVDWKSRNIKVLEDAYKFSPYFDVHMPVLEAMIRESTDNLIDFNMAAINYIRKCLDITTPMICASGMPVESHKSELVFDLCVASKADIYLSGAGGRDYLDTAKFKEAGIQVYYQNFNEEISYHQHTDEFIPYMSTIDILMNLSNADARKYIESAFTYSD